MSAHKFLLRYPMHHQCENVKPQLKSSILTCLWKLVWLIIKHFYEHVCLLIHTYNSALPKQDSGTKQNLVALCRNYINQNNNYSKDSDFGVNNTKYKIIYNLLFKKPKL
jgi:hypothetical protein